MLKLVKTTGGTNGAPRACKGCGCEHFINAGFSWHCSGCGVYIPSDFNSPIYNLESRLSHLKSLQGQFRKAVDDLERLVTE